MGKIVMQEDFVIVKNDPSMILEKVDVYESGQDEFTLTGKRFNIVYSNGKELLTSFVKRTGVLEKNQKILPDIKSKDFKKKLIDQNPIVFHTHSKRNAFIELFDFILTVVSLNILQFNKNLTLKVFVKRGYYNLGDLIISKYTITKDELDDIKTIKKIPKGIIDL